jgi:glycerol-3-phosphate dehydrogenase
LHTRVLIIGGGVTGTGIARDISLRGVPCIVVEKEDLNAGASGANHGLLHSGARYIESDPAAAEECKAEGELLKSLASQCVEDTGGLFIAVQGDEEEYISAFQERCKKCGIFSEAVDVITAREMEPALSEKVIAAFRVQDASIDPFRLTLENMADAVTHGATLLRHKRVIKFHKNKRGIAAVSILDEQSGEETTIEADLIINASGAWAGQVAEMVGVKIGMVYSKGTLLVSQNRITGRVINRLRRPSDGDILVPGGVVSIIGTTSSRISSPDEIAPDIDEADFIIHEAVQMVPTIASEQFIRAYSGVRPLLETDSEQEDRSISRGFALIDHSENGLDNFITITGGKLTTYRLMAEKTSDLACFKLKVNKPCQTRTIPLPDTGNGRWTEPALSSKIWMEENKPGDTILCECEMVSTRTIDSIIESLNRQNCTPDLNSIGLRSRLGKGPCQGTFCSAGLAAYLYDKGILTDENGLSSIREFLRERWRGRHPILTGDTLIRVDLLEAIYCGVAGLEL